MVTLVIESSQGAFVLGGFQIESNSKMIQVYLQREATAAKEYLTTCRAIGDPCKALCVIPGGPRQVARLYLELRSLQPIDGEMNTVLLKSLKLTARIPDTTPTESSSDSPGHLHAQPQSTSMFPTKAIPGPSRLSSMSQDEISSAMAVVSMMMRATEQRIVHAAARQIQEQGARHEQQIKQLTGLVLEQRMCIQQQSQLLTMQSSWLKQQAEQLAELREGQGEILRAIRQPQAGVEQTLASDNPTADAAADVEEDSGDTVVIAVDVDGSVEELGGYDDGQTGAIDTTSDAVTSDLAAVVKNLTLPTESSGSPGPMEHKESADGGDLPGHNSNISFNLPENSQSCEADFDDDLAA